MTIVYLALGSNVGDSARHIKQAVNLLRDQLHNIKQAPVYESRAVGYTDQPNFLNTVISGNTNLSPESLLAYLKEIEKKVGRTETFRNGPREIDIDIIFYGDQVLETDKLTIPHPSFSQRDFVLQSLSDLNSELVDPLSGQTVGQLLDQVLDADRSIINRVDGKA
jgi:2-amino-4-hydroxy-6-hydroxymethyldihydropteridine diphosphokinase